MKNEQLVVSLKHVLANTFEMYAKAHGLHWNIEGINFGQFHDYFDSLYNELWYAVDPIAEHIRVLDSYVEYGSSVFSQNSSIVPTNIFGDKADEMLTDLQVANEIVLLSLKTAFDNASGLQGLQNFLADRIDIHEAHGWKIRSYLKKV